MFSFLNKNYHSLGHKKFSLFAPILCFICDIALLNYVINEQLPNLVKGSTVKLMLSLRNPGLAGQISQGELNDIALLMQNQMAFVFTCFLVFHFIIYSLAAMNKKWPLKYISNYTFFGALLSSIEILIVFNSDSSISLYTLFTMLGYLYIYLGYRYFKKTKKPVR